MSFGEPANSDLILKDWSKRTGQPGQDLRSIVMHIGGPAFLLQFYVMDT